MKKKEENKHNIKKHHYVGVRDQIRQQLPNILILEREPRTFIHVKRAKRFDPVG